MDVSGARHALMAPPSARYVAGSRRRTNETLLRASHVAGLELVWLEQLDAVETARRMQLPIERVYVAKSRVLKRLQQAVREVADEWVELSAPAVPLASSGAEL